MGKCLFPPAVIGCAGSSTRQGGSLRGPGGRGGGGGVAGGGPPPSTVIRGGPPHPKALVNIKKIHELKGLRWEPAEGLILGALVTHREIETSSLVREKFPILCELE